MGETTRDGKLVGEDGESGFKSRAEERGGIEEIREGEERRGERERERERESRGEETKGGDQ